MMAPAVLASTFEVVYWLVFVCPRSSSFTMIIIGAPEDGFSGARVNPDRTDRGF